MITCPWCGTSYAVFQSTCNQCGGPLHPPEVFARAVESPIIPPAPPRPISDSYLWKLMFADPWSITSLIFAFIGGIFTVVGFGLTIGVITAFVGVPFLLMGILFFGGGAGVLVWRYQTYKKQVQVLKQGCAVLGYVTDVQENLALTVNGRHPWSITYQYSANGKGYTGRVSTLSFPGPHMQPGKSAYVLYLADEPATSSIYPHP